MGAKKRLFIDMDGTLAEYRTFEAMEQYYQKGYFESLKPLQNVVDAVKEVIETCPDIEVYTLSACPDCSTVPMEKGSWLDRFLPEIPKENRIYTLIGQEKRKFIPGGIDKNDYLLDDYPHNLHDWCKEGSGIKLFNGLNANLEKWSGACISYKNSPSHIAASLEKIILKGELVIDNMDEIQIKNEERGQSLYINRDELSQIIEKFFKTDFTDVDDFRRNYSPSDWDFIKRISATARVETHTNSKQYAFEYDTLKKKIDNTISVVIESLSNQRKDLVEKEVQFYIPKWKDKEKFDAVISLEESYGIWHDYFAKTFNDLERMMENFFARYEAASKGPDFSGISLQNDKRFLLSKVKDIKEICEKIYARDKETLKEWYDNIKNKNISLDLKVSLTKKQIPDTTESVGDSVLNDDVVSNSSSQHFVDMIDFGR